MHLRGFVSAAAGCPAQLPFVYLTVFDRFPVRRGPALERWHEFLPEVIRYGARRNHVTHDHSHVSRLSPAVRLGVIRPEELVRDTLTSYPLHQVEKWVQEVCWRTYWKGWLEMRPQVWHSWRRRVAELHSTLPIEVRERCAAVTEGRSGVAIMDHFAKELRMTGYLHNHARMWWASFWVHVERLPWELGADFFFRHLLDADPASNTLSWRWVAGLQTVGKTYLVRRSNLERYCEPSLLQDTSGLSQLDDDQNSPFIAKEDADLTRHSLPDWSEEAPVLTGRVGIWLHPDDLCAELGPLACLRPVAIAGFTSQAVYERMRLSHARVLSLHTALEDGVTRASQHFQAAGTVTDHATSAVGMASWVEREKLDAVVSFVPNVGPIADALPQIREALAVRGVGLHLVRRPWDAKLFALSKSGFFPFWEKTSRWLKDDFENVVRASVPTTGE
jgi:deoxyribodipyrimidine photo-lyase